MYATYADYVNYFGNGIAENEYERYAFEADRALDVATTGIDGVKKLQVAYPHEDAEIIFCACKIADCLRQIAEIEASAGFTDGANGRTGKAIASMTSGNESISYSSGDTAITRAAVDVAERKRLISSVIKEYLSGVTDANGVNLLYMGVYPCTVTQ